MRVAPKCAEYEAQRFIRVTVPVQDERERVWKTDVGDEKERANSFSLTAGAVLGRRPVAKVGHTDAKCTWFTCENGQLTGVIGKRTRTRCGANSRKCPNLRVQSSSIRVTCEDPGLTRGKEAREEWRRISVRRTRTMQKQQQRTWRATWSDGGIRERNERYATIKPECRGAPRPRETPKFSSIFLSQEGRVGAEDAFAIPAVLLWCCALQTLAR